MKFAAVAAIAVVQSAVVGAVRAPTTTTEEPGCHDCIGEWSSWETGKCSESCGGGLAESRRTFMVTRAVEPGGKDCPYEDGSVDTKSEDCNTDCCPPVDCEGEWSAYREATACSASCDGGVLELERTFMVIREAENGGENCEYKDGALDTTEEECNTDCCPIDCDGVWSEWVEGECSASCDGGVVESERYFSVITKASNGGKACLYEDGEKDTKSEECNTDCCPTDCDGVWSEWVEGECSASCDGGVVESERYFSIITKATNGGKACPYEDGEKDTKSEECNTDCCPTDCEGEWSKWVEGECSASCDGGIVESERFYTVTAEASNGGKSCPYEHGEKDTKSEECNTDFCPTDCDGVWSEWVEGECSASCDGGVIESERVYTVLTKASNGGKSCPYEDGEKDTKSEECNTDCCPTDCEGEWSEWVEGECSASCDGGIVESERFYTIITKATNGGKSCPYEDGEKDTKSEECNTDCCPPEPCEGEWSEWSEWGECSKTCGTRGKRKSKRTFSITKHAKNGGAECLHKDGKKEKRKESCNQIECPVDCEGEWSSWKDGECSVSCGGGISTLERTFMVLTKAEGGGKDCPYEDGEVDQTREECNTDCCPPPKPCVGEWTEWSTTECSAKCGGGESTTSRTFVVTEFAENGGEQCEYEHGEVESTKNECNTHCCDVDCEGYWSEWVHGECSVSCGGGFLQAQRTFHVTRSAEGNGKQCEYTDGYCDIQQSACNEEECPCDRNPYGLRGRAAQ